MHGPTKYCRIKFPNLYTDSGTQKIRLLLGHIRNNEKTLTILRKALGCSQQDFGIGSFILNKKYSTYETLINNSWLAHLWKFLDTVDGTIQYHNSWKPHQPFRNDINMIEHIIKTELEPHIISQFNICRLYKKVYFLGDILDTTVTKLHPNVLDVSNLH